MRSKFELPSRIPETGIAKEEKRKFNMLLRVVERLIPVQGANEAIDVTEQGTVRRRQTSSTLSEETTEGRWY